MKNIATPPKLEIAGLKDGRDITRPFIGPLLYPLDTVLRSQNHDYKVYTALLRDSQLFSCLQQRIAKLIACETIIDAASDSDIDVAAADFLRNMLNEIGWDAVCERMLYAIFFGFSIAEIQWAYRDGHHTIDRIEVRSQERFRFDTELKPRLITPQNWQGEELPDRKFWTLTFGGHRSDEPYGLGLAHQLYWLVYFKRNGMKSWLKFLDRFGHPLPLVKYGANATDEQKQQALEIALSLAEDSAAAAPEGLVFELVETARSGTADYTQLIALLDSGISKIILSQTMTTDSGSSRSQAEVHGSVADAIVKSDADLLSESFNRTIGTWVTELNFPGATPPRMYRKTQADQDLKAIADRDKVLFDMGYAPNTEYIVETFGEGFRPPEKGEASPIALNGAQVTALTTTISQAISDGWIPELAVATIRASFPTIGADLITAIAEQLQAQVDKSAELLKPQEAIASPEQAAAQFGEVETTADFAAKKAPKGKKDCQKGKICKGSCIAKDKTCLGELNTAQLAEHKAAQKAAKKTKGGGGSADPVVGTNDVVSVVAPIPIKKAGSIAELDPASIEVDPKRFQYKILGAHTASGSVGSLTGVGKWDSNLAGIVQVWVDPADGKTYVVNGHNRLDLARKLGADVIAVRYLDVKNAQEARAVGALTNIAEGRGTAIDAAKFFKDSGITRDDLAAKGIPMREKIAQDGVALSKLDDSLFRRVIDNDMPIERATIVGSSGLSHDQQRSLVSLVDKRKSMTNETLKELTETVKASESKSTQQFDLFGASDIVQNNAIERAGLAAAVKQRLSRDKKLFGTVGKSSAADALTKAGNVIDAAQSKQISQEAARTLAIFDQFKNLSGPVSLALNKAADRVINGESSKKVQADLYKEISIELPKMLGGNK